MPTSTKSLHGGTLKLMGPNGNYSGSKPAGDAGKTAELRSATGAATQTDRALPRRTTRSAESGGVTGLALRNLAPKPR